MLTKKGNKGNGFTLLHTVGRGKEKQSGYVSIKTPKGKQLLVFSSVNKVAKGLFKCIMTDKTIYVAEIEEKVCIFARFCEGTDVYGMQVILLMRTPERLNDSILVQIEGDKFVVLKKSVSGNCVYSNGVLFACYPGVPSSNPYEILSHLSVKGAELFSAARGGLAINFFVPPSVAVLLKLPAGLSLRNVESVEYEDKLTMVKACSGRFYVGYTGGYYLFDEFDGFKDFNIIYDNGIADIRVVFGKRDGIDYWAYNGTATPVCNPLFIGDTWYRLADKDTIQRVENSEIQAQVGKMLEKMAECGTAGRVPCRNDSVIVGRLMEDGKLALVNGQTYCYGEKVAGGDFFPAEVESFLFTSYQGNGEQLKCVTSEYRVIPGSQYAIKSVITDIFGNKKTKLVTESGLMRRVSSQLYVVKNPAGFTLYSTKKGMVYKHGFDGVKYPLAFCNDSIFVCLDGELFAVCDAPYGKRTVKVYADFVKITADGVAALDSANGVGFLIGENFSLTKMGVSEWCELPFYQIYDCSKWKRDYWKIPVPIGKNNCVTEGTLQDSEVF